MTEKPVETTDAMLAEEEEDEHEKNILKLINEKSKDNLAMKLKLLSLLAYSKQEQDNSEKMNEEMDAITLKYNKLVVPIIHKSNDIINGKHLEEEDIKNYNGYLAEGEETKKDEILAKEAQPISDYWLKVFKANLGLREEIKEYDEEPLKALRRIEYFPSEKVEEPYNFSLKFTFAPNDYFENDVLIKEFQMIDEREAEKAECTEIKWKEGKNITKKSIKKKQKNKKTGQSRTTTKLVDQDSFFTFFRNMEAKDEEEEEEEEEEAEEELDNIDRHVEIGQTISEEILPYSSEYYLGVRKDPDFGDGDYKAIAEEDEEEDEDDDEDDDKAKGKGKSKGKAKGKAEEKTLEKEVKQEVKQECKQQ